MISYKEFTPSARQFNMLTDSVGWGTRDEAVVEKALKNSLFCLGAFDDDKLIGFARIIGDETIFLYIQDVMVMPQYAPLNSVPSGVRINIYQKLSNKVPAFRIYLRNGSSNYIRFLQVDSIDGDAYTTNQNSFYFANLFYSFTSNNNVNTLITYLENWLESPVWEQNTANQPPVTELDSVVSNNETKFLYNPVFAREGLPYYAHYQYNYVD